MMSNTNKGTNYENNITPNSVINIAEIRRLRQEIETSGETTHLISRLEKLEHDVATEQMAQLDAEKLPEQDQIEANKIAQMREKLEILKRGKSSRQWKDSKRKLIREQLNLISSAEDEEAKMEEEITFLQLQKLLDEL